MEESIYNLKLHEEVKVFEGTYAMRVAGGWLYQSIDRDVVISQVFVPFNREFKPLPPKKS